MRRREVILAALAGLLCAAPVAAQQSGPSRMPRIGILTPASTDDTAIFQAFRRGLNEVGYTEGHNILLEFCFLRPDTAAKLAAELVALPVDLIVTDGALAARAAQQATIRLPIVMGTSGIDPVSLGLAQSLRRLGGNVTGFTLLHRQLSEKRVDLIRTAGLPE